VPGRASGTPNWPLLALALVGILIAGYLTAVAWRGQPVAGCASGSGCDLVLSSPWARLFGLPTALWGVVLYAGLAGLALAGQADRPWRWAWLLSLVGLLYSAGLTVVSLGKLGAACPYCLASAGTLAVIFATLTSRRPESLSRPKVRAWMIRSGASGLALVGLLHLHQAGVWGRAPAAEDPNAGALARHLAATGATFYGAAWCPHCQEQKALFGASAGRLPYVECSPRGRTGPQAAACAAAGVRRYPTWIIRGRRYERVLTLEELAEHSGFEPDHR
jgi:uncharacterized membrane protein